jgi:hypothetical protein
VEFPKKLRAKIISHLRRIGYENTTYKAAMASAHRGFGEWECCQCKGIFSRKELHGDHTICVIDPETGFVDWNTYIERLFLGQIQPLCLNCHQIKSSSENKIRRGKRAKKN